MTCLPFPVYSPSFLFSLSRYKLKFSPDKVDTMIIQAICKLPLAYKHSYVMKESDLFCSTIG